MKYEQTKDKSNHKKETSYYKNSLIELIETLDENQIRSLYYIGLGMKKE